MPRSFDKEAWLSRIWNSQVRRGPVSTPGEQVTASMDYAAVIGIEIVIDWLAKRGISVEFTKRAGGYYDPAAKKIIASAHQPVQAQLHIILHECGHILISERSRDKYPHGYKKIDEALEGRDVLHKIDVLAEEFDAWHKAKKLAERLGIILDRDEFDKTKAKCLMSYVKWTTRRGRVSDN